MTSIKDRQMHERWRRLQERAAQVDRKHSELGETRAQLKSVQLRCHQLEGRISDLQHQLHQAQQELVRMNSAQFQIDTTKEISVQNLHRRFDPQHGKLFVSSEGTGVTHRSCGGQIFAFQTIEGPVMLLCSFCDKYEYLQTSEPPKTEEKSTRRIRK